MVEGIPGITQAELDALHQFTEEYRVKLRAEKEAVDAENRRIQAERIEQNAQMKSQLEHTKAAYEHAYTTLVDEQDQVFPTGDGNFIVLRKSSDRIRVALTNNEHKTLGGYLPSFDDITNWQEVGISAHTKSGRPEAHTLYHWDRQRLDQHTADTYKYWGLSEQIPFNDVSKLDFDQLKTATQILARAVPLPAIP